MQCIVSHSCLNCLRAYMLLTGLESGVQGGLRLSHMWSSAVHSYCMDQRYRVHQDELVMPVDPSQYHWPVRFVRKTFLTVASRGLMRCLVFGVVLTRNVHLLVRQWVKAANAACGWVMATDERRSSKLCMGRNKTMRMASRSHESVIDF